MAPSSAVAQLIAHAPGTAAHYLRITSLEKLLSLGSPGVASLLRHYRMELRKAKKRILYDEAPCSYIITLKTLLPTTEPTLPVIPMDREIDHFVVNNQEHSGIPKLDYCIMYHMNGTWRPAAFLGMEPGGVVLLHVEGDQEGEIRRARYRAARICLATEYEYLINDLGFAALWVHASTEPSNEDKTAIYSTLAAQARKKLRSE